MKRLLVLLFLAISVFLLGEELVVYTYDSLLPFAREAFPLFEEKTGVNVLVKTFGDAGALLAKLISEKGKTDVDIVIGIDNLLAERAFEEDLFISYLPDNARLIRDLNLIFDPLWRLTPYDYGAIALIYDRNELGELSLSSMDDLTKKEFEKSIIIEDPRTSSTGLAFLMWTYALYGDEFLDFWQKFKKSVLTITLGWDDAFEKFEAGEAPMMVSYATDGAYSYEYYGEVSYGTLIPGNIGYVQIEGAGIVKWSEKKELAKEFIEFLISPEAQAHIPLNQWMFPVVETQMPESFEYALIPKEVVTVKSVDVEKIINLWERAIY
ncbi:ABC transporter substrate-binding protein [Kosmotoga arenicorallina S304]|uniref:ABC transporter substrate-binding protein n=1 Tax=Kosmotoga arenicorallina S304 TaxID=1453497 RepID=A0A176K436_9BACT|nr:thiamine ABC transporter substrate-binding protein [Kosmotoga arenicorallina]OAA31877.1 ABC transporter substrate-binding protein [Kosmotoga arenicorallina S304]